jgi:hypothetical protein
MDDEAFLALNDCKSLCVERIHEPHDNDLRLILYEARYGEPVTSGNQLGQLVKHPRRFELLWRSTVGYSVRNECYASNDDYEEYRGRVAVIYEQSRYLDYLRFTTFATDDYPGPLQSWGYLRPQPHR